MATLSVQTISRTGTSPTYASAAGGGDQFQNDGSARLHVKNGGGSPITVTIDSPNTCSFGASASSAHDYVTSVPAGGEKFIGPFSADQFNDPNGMVQISYSAVTSVTVAVIR